MNFSALNTHAIGVVAASAGAVVEGAGSFSAGATASAQATLHSHATATAINSVALTTTQSVVRFATAIATLGCSAAANVDGYRVQFSNAEIVCTASSDANAVVQRQAVVYVTAQATNVAVGSRVAYTSASLQAECNLTANSGRVAFAQSTMDTSAALSASASVSTIFYSIAAIAASAASSATASTISNTSGDITASAVVTSSAYYTKFTSASIVGACSVVSDSVLQATVQCTVAAQAQLTSSAYISGSTTAEVVASSELVTNPYKIAIVTSATCVGSSLAISVGSKKAVAHTTFNATATLDASAIAINAASADISATADISSHASVESDVSAAVNASAAMVVLDYLEQFSVAAVICNSALVVQPVTIAGVTAEVDCVSAIGSNGYILLEAEGSILCSSTIETSASVEFDVSAAINADSSCTAEGYNLAIATASCAGTGSLVSAAGVQAYTQADISAQANVLANSSMVHDVEAYISGLSIAISVAEKIAVSHTQLACIADISAEAYSELGTSVTIVCAADVAVDAYVPNPVFAEASIITGHYENQTVWTAIPNTRFGIDTGYFTNLSGVKQWKVAQYVMRPGHYTVETGSATGDNQYASFWDTYRLDGNMRKGSSLDWVWSETRNFSYAGGSYNVNFQIPVHDIEQSSVVSVWVATPVPSAEVTASGAVLGGSFANLACSAEVTAASALLPIFAEGVVGSAVVTAHAATQLYTSATVSAVATATADANLLRMASAYVSDTGYSTAGYWTDATYAWVNTSLTIEWVNGTWSSGSYFDYPYRDAGYLDTFVTGNDTTVRHSVQQHVITVASVFIPTFWTVTGIGPTAEVTAEAYTFTRVILAQASVNATSSMSASAGKAIMAEARVSSAGYLTPASSVDVTTWSNVTGAWVFKSNANDYARWYQIPNAISSDYAVTSSSNYPITSQGLRLGSSFAYSTYYESENSTSYTGYSYYIEEPTVTTQAIPEYWTITGTGPSAEVTAESYIFTHRIDVEASITATSSMSAFGTNQNSISATAYVSDTGYLTESHWTNATYAWVSTDLIITWTNGTWSSGNYFDYPYRDAGFLDTFVTGSNTFIRHNVEQHVITVASVFIPTFWTDTGTGPVAIVTASGSVFAQGTADLDCLANLTGQCHVTRSTTANVNASAGFDALATKYHLAYGSAEINASCEVSATSEAGTTLFAAYSDVTAECHIAKSTTANVNASAGLDVLATKYYLVAYGSADINATSSVSALGTNDSVANVSGPAATVTASGYVFAQGAAEVVSTADVTSSPVAILWANAALVSTAELSFQLVKVAVASVDATGAAAVSALHPSIIRLSSASINAFAQIEEQASAHSYTSAEVVCLSQFESEAYVVRTIPAVTLEGTADFNVEFTVVVQEGTRSNGIHILVEAESRVIAVEDIDRSTLVELDARIVYAEAA